MLRQIALVSQSVGVDASELAVVSAALQKQVTRDLAPIWGVQATVDAFPRLEDVPVGYYRIIARDDLQATQGVKGVHYDPEKQPFALIQYTGDETWSVFASHECLEMLADPSLNRLVAGASIKPGQGRVEYLVEICDPCQDESLSYRVNGVLVSDFCTPQYFDPVAAPGVRYSFAGSLKAPREIRDGGYLSWVVPETHEWWVAVRFGTELSFVEIDAPTGAASIRESVDRITQQRDTSSPKRGIDVAAPSSQRLVAQRASYAHAKALGRMVDQLVSAGRAKSAMARKAKGRRKR